MGAAVKLDFASAALAFAAGGAFLVNANVMVGAEKAEAEATRRAGIKKNFIILSNVLELRLMTLLKIMRREGKTRQPLHDAALEENS